MDSVGFLGERFLSSRGLSFLKKEVGQNPRPPALLFFSFNGRFLFSKKEKVLAKQARFSDAARKPCGPRAGYRCATSPFFFFSQVPDWISKN